MVGYRLSLLVVILFSMAISPMTFAKSVELKTLVVDLDTSYGKLKTEIHFDARDLEVALKVKKIILTDLIKAVEYFHYVPINTVHLNVDPYLRLTNGNARVFPTNIVNLFNFPASNAEHLIVMEDWLRGLVFHEYIHITHLDQTNDYLEVGRIIFGSVAKLIPAIVPRWFTEGIAVWGESYLINGGRLNNALFRKELLIQFLRIEYCKTIDCLDEPGVYPHGQLAYWAGAHFIEYLENQKAGTVKCLVERNSSGIPFFLNNVFQHCTGRTAQDLFEEFRKNLINDQPELTPENEAWGDKISNAFGSDDLQKGIVLDGNKLFKLEKNRYSEALVSYDLQDNVNMVVSKYHHPVSQLAGISHVPQADNEQSDEGKFLIVAFNEDMNYREQNRVWRLVNTETLLVETLLPFINDPSYVIGLGNNSYLTASFINNTWLIEKQKIDLTAGKLVDSEVVHHFASEVNLVNFRKEGQRIFVKLNRGDLGSALYVTDLSLEKFYNIYESKEYFDIPLTTAKFVVIKEKDNYSLLEIGEDFESITKAAMAKNLFNRVTSAEISGERVIVLENRLKSKEMTATEIMEFLKRDLGNVETVGSTAAAFQDVDPVINLEELNIQSFPKMYHMQPYYWFLATGTSENLTSIGATTTFSDPMDLNVLNATVLLYPAESRVGGSLDYFHKFSSISDLWSINASFNHEYSRTDFSTVTNQTTEGLVGSRYSILMKRWTWIPGLFTTSTNTKDFISNRSTISIGTDHVINYSASVFDDYFQNLTFQMKFQNSFPKDNDDYLSLQTKISALGRFHEKVEGGVTASYGKLYKSGFRDGVIYGGGVNNLSESRWHEFYGLPYSNAYGNEIATARIYLDWNFWNIYRGHNFFPVYFKEAHLILGREAMTADRIILDKRVYREKTIHSFFIGPKLKTNLFYFVPADIDVIFSAIKRPGGNDTLNQLEVNLTAKF